MRVPRLVAVALALAFVALAFAPSAAAQMDRPTWSVGDFWEYEFTGDTLGVSGSGTMRMTVVGPDTTTVGSRSFSTHRVNVTVNLTGGPITFRSGAMWVSVADLSIVKLVTVVTVTIPFLGMATLTTTVTYDPPLEMRWPLVRDRTWTATSDVTTLVQTQGLPDIPNTVSISQTNTVQSNTQVTVPAGTFDTIPVRMKTGDGSVVTYWSPQAGNDARQEAYDSQGVQQASAELTEYRYQGAGFLGIPTFVWFLLLVLVAILVAVWLYRRRARPMMMPPGPYPPAQPPTPPKPSP